MFIVLPYEVEMKRERRPFATYAIIGLNAVIFLATRLLDEDGLAVLFMRHGFIPEEWTRLHTFATCMFLHGGWLHVIGNMYFLWVFGAIVESRVGAAKYVALYLVSGIAACLAHLVTTPDFFSNIPTVGASGAISGMLGAAIALAPRTKLKCFYLWLAFLRPLFGKFRVSAVVFLGLWFAGQLLYAVTFTEIGASIGVAYWAHIGGFAFGAAAATVPAVVFGWSRVRSRLARRRRYSRAMSASRKGDRNAAAGLLQETYDSGDDSLEADLALARIRLDLGEPENAVPPAREALRRAEASRDRRSTVEAYYVLSEAGGESGLKPHDYVVVARSMAELGRKREAEGVVMEGLRRHPEHPPAGPKPLRRGEGPAADTLLYELGDLNVALKEPARARDVFRLLVKLFPDSRLSESARWRLKELEAAASSA